MDKRSQLYTAFGIISAGVALWITGDVNVPPIFWLKWVGGITTVVGVLIFAEYLFLPTSTPKFQRFRQFLKGKRNWLKKNAKKIEEDLEGFVNGSKKGFSMKETHWQLNLMNGIETALGKDYREFVKQLFENWNLNRDNKNEEIRLKLQFLDGMIAGLKITATDLLKDFDPDNLKQYEPNESVEGLDGSKENTNMIEM